MRVQIFENRQDCLDDLAGEKRRHSVPNLNELLCSIAKKLIIVRKSLKSSHLSHYETPTLGWVGVDEIVAILRNVAGDRG